MNLEKTLKDFFWHDWFREWQKEIVESIIDGNDTLVFMPTGGGKSLTYQMPWVVLEGLTIVISPLISLMKDQVDALGERWIKARLINSTLSSEQIESILEELQSERWNPIKFLYIAPERLNSYKFIQTIKDLKIALLAIDEAHCISQWWHDFRPSYMKILSFVDVLKKESSITYDIPPPLRRGLGWGSVEWKQKESSHSFPIVWLTATATQKVREDIQKRLWLTQYNTFISWFDRKNITIVVREISKISDKIWKIEEVLQKISWSGIVYCSSRKSVKEVYDELEQRGISVWMYTWEMTPEHREYMQDNFMSGKTRVIVATNAFGMWIDKKDIRSVIHYNLPWSIENYYQEVGRWWRDGKKSFWVVLASYGDTKIQEFFIENTYPEKSEVLDLYDFLYKHYSLWAGKWETILKTYGNIAAESAIGNDMKVGSIIKVLEKYGVLERGYRSDTDDWFRGRWLTLTQEKRTHNNLLIDWNRQESLKNEAYFKLEEIKKLFFFPHCRKRYILNYFWDTEDLELLWDDCKTCDYCLGGKKHTSGDMTKLLPVSVYALVLELIKKYDEKFWVQLFVKLLAGSQEKRIFEWNLDRSEFYGALREYSTEAISGIIECLIYEWYLFKQSGKYPLLWITELGEAVIYREKQLQENLSTLNTLLVTKVGTNILKNPSNHTPRNLWSSQLSWSKKITYDETLKYYKQGKTLEEISQIRELTLSTVESHIIRLYEIGKISIIQILKFTQIWKVQAIKSHIQEYFPNWVEKLRELKDSLEQVWKIQVAYFDIKIALAMIEKKDV